MSGAQAILSQPLCAFAFCWRLERSDGVTIGLTSHDRTLTVDGLAYGSAPGITPSAITRSRDLSVELTEVAGALSSAALDADDLRAGRWDGAALSLHLTEWTDPGALWLELASGTLGAVEQSGDRFSVALRGLDVLLDRSVVPVTSPTCRAQLGDRACTVDLRQHRRIVSITAVDDVEVTVAGLTAGVYAFGELRWLEGPMTGIAQLIVDQTGGALILSESPALPVAPGTRALLTEGCDKRLDTCVSRFANAANFRGEPFLPGMDLLTRYPGA